MKALLTCVVTFFSLAAFSQTWIQPETAEKQKGNMVIVMGFVTDVTYVTDAKSYTALFQLNEKDSNKSLLVIFRSSVQPKFTKAETPLLHQYVEVKGKVEMYKGKSQIIVQSENEIAIVKESPDDKIYEPL